MNSWGILILISLSLSLLNNAHAHIKEVPTTEEDLSGATRIRPEGSDDVLKVDSSNSLGRDKEDTSKFPQEDAEEPSTFFFSDKMMGSPPGGGIRALDPKLLEPIEPSPILEMSWWDKLWISISEWLWGPSRVEK